MTNETPRLNTEQLEVTLNTFLGSAQSGNVAHSMGCVYIILRELVMREKEMDAAAEEMAEAVGGPTMPEIVFTPEPEQKTESNVVSLFPDAAGPAPETSS